MPRAEAENGYSCTVKVVAQNRRARFDYELLDTVEAGLMLTGQEVKSCRLGHCDLKGAYVSFQTRTPTLRQMTIHPYPQAGKLPDYQPSRERELLLKKPEMEMLRAASEEQGLTVIPVEVRAGKFVKVFLAVARGRKRFDKRQKIKERDVSRRLRQGE